MSVRRPPLHFPGVVRRTIVLALLAASTACESQEDRAGEVRRLVARYDSAWAAKDVAAIERHLAPDYTYFTSNGELSTRDETLRFMADTSYILTDLRRSDLEIALVGPVARVASRWEGTGRFHGAPVRDDQTCGQIWVEGDGGWRLFSEHCVNRPPKAR